MNYKLGTLSGYSTIYHPNGTVKRREENIQSEPSANQMVGNGSALANVIFNTETKVNYDADSNGIVNISDGNGHLKEIIKYPNDELIQEGDYVSGFKNGIWNGKFSSNGLSYKEVYNMNKLVSGESVKDGKTYLYTSNMEAPEFSGGQKAWNAYLGSSIKYPTDAVTDRIKGVVLTSFVIDQNGKVVDIKIERSVSSSLDAEAKRVLNYSPKWKPGKQRGIPVRVRYNQRINFDF